VGDFLTFKVAKCDFKTWTTSQIFSVRI